MSMKSLLNSQVSYNRAGLTCCIQETGSKRPRFTSRNRSSIWAVVLIVKLLNAQPPEFDVASVKPNKATAGERATSRENIDVTAGKSCNAERESDFLYQVGFRCQGISDLRAQLARDGEIRYRRQDRHSR